MTLKEARILFTARITSLLQWILTQGKWKVALGRDFDESNEPLRHMKGSLHYLGLANDLALYDSDGNYLRNTEDYREVGEYWKSLGPENRWGGDFKKADGNHFSLTFGGKS